MCKEKTKTIAVFSNPRDERNRVRFIEEPLKETTFNIISYKPKSVFELVKCTFFNSTKFDLVILITGWEVMDLFVYLSSRLKKIPVLGRTGGRPTIDIKSRIKTLNLKHRVRLFLAKINIKLCRNIIIVNPAHLPYFKSLKIKNIFVVPQFTEIPNRPVKLQETNNLELLTVTNLNYKLKYEGVKWIIEALYATDIKCKITIRFRVAGGGTYLEKLKNYYQIIPSNENINIEILGFVNNIEDLYTSSDIMLYHSEHDATPNVILEGKKFGLPIIASHCAEFQFLIKNEHSGFLYKNRNEFINQLNLLVNDKNLRHLLGQNAKNDLMKKFSKMKIRNKLISVINNIVQ